MLHHLRVLLCKPFKRVCTIVESKTSRIMLFNLRLNKKSNKKSTRFVKYIQNVYTMCADLDVYLLYLDLWLNQRLFSVPDKKKSLLRF